MNTTQVDMAQEQDEVCGYGLGAEAAGLTDETSIRAWIHSRPAGWVAGADIEQLVEYMMFDPDCSSMSDTDWNAGHGLWLKAMYGPDSPAYLAWVQGEKVKAGESAAIWPLLVFGALVAGWLYLGFEGKGGKHHG
jgi:hypothetical protein